MQEGRSPVRRLSESEVRQIQFFLTEPVEIFARQDKDRLAGLAEEIAEREWDRGGGEGRW